MTQREFYNSQQWQKVRALARQRAGGLCERCAKEGIIKGADVIHHIKPITESNVNDPNVTVNLDNLMALCTECHAAVHSGGKKKRYTIDAAGRIAPRSQ